jgi:hypothetical protein
MKEDTLDRLLFKTFMLIMIISTVFVAASIPFMIYGMFK